MAKNLTNCRNPEHSFVVEKNIILPDEITSVDISDNGKIAACTSNANITIFDAISNEIVKVIPCKKGADKLQFNHAKYSMLFNCMDSKNIVKSYDYATGQYLTEFVNNKANIRSISMHPQKDIFVTCNENKTLSIWDIRSGSEIDSSRICAPGIASYHPDGIAIFAANHDGMFVYDTRRFSSGSLMAYLPARPFDYLRCVRFSPNGKYVAVLDGDLVETMYTKEISPAKKFTGFSNDKNVPLDLCFSVDSSTFITGTTNGDLAIWKIKEESSMHTICSDMQIPIQSMKLNPEYMQLCTAAGKNLTFWQLANDYVNLFYQTFKSVIEPKTSQASVELELNCNPTVTSGVIESEGNTLDIHAATETLTSSSSIEPKSETSQEWLSNSSTNTSADFELYDASIAVFKNKKSSNRNGNKEHESNELTDESRFKLK